MNTKVNPYFFGGVSGSSFFGRHFAQPQVARRAKCMDALSESIHGVLRKELPNSARAKVIHLAFLNQIKCMLLYK